MTEVNQCGIKHAQERDKDRDLNRKNEKSHNGKRTTFVDFNRPQMPWERRELKEKAQNNEKNGSVHGPKRIRAEPVFGEETNSTVGGVAICSIKH